MQLRQGSTRAARSFGFSIGSLGSLLYLVTLLLCMLSISFAKPVEWARDDLLIEEPADANRTIDDEETYWHQKRTYFPDSPPSCQLCEQHYADIDSCANASVPLANFSQIIYNPLSFLEIIACACTDTFQSTYPQCVDCFTQTNQTGFLAPPDGNLSSIIVGMRQICALGSAIFGGVASANSQLPGETPITVTSIAAALGKFTHPLLFGDNARVLLIGFATILTGILTGMWTVL